MKVALCVCGRLGNRYVSEYVKHYKNLGFDIKDYPNAYNLYKNEVTLPLHTCLSDEDVFYVIECFNKVYKDMI